MCNFRPPLTATTPVGPALPLRFGVRSWSLDAKVVPSVPEARSDGLQRTVRAVRMRADPSCLLADLIFSHFQIEVRLQANPVAIGCAEIC
jgi:hypothetical protein